MLSKNNHNLKIKQASDRQLRFSLRKFGTGIARQPVFYRQQRHDSPRRHQ